MTTNGTTPPTADRPTRVRYSILFLLCLLAMITYMDRAMYGSASSDLMKAIGRNAADFNIVLFFFQFAYALFEIPTGWMGDRFGTRSTLLRIVLWWSLFIALTGMAGLVFPRIEWGLIGFGLFLLMQFCFGMGEAGAVPESLQVGLQLVPANAARHGPGFDLAVRPVHGRAYPRVMGGADPLLRANLAAEPVAVFRNRAGLVRRLLFLVPQPAERALRRE